MLLCLSWEFTSSPCSISNLLGLWNAYIAECLRNVACIYMYLELKGNQFEVAFYFSYIGTYTIRVMFTHCTHAAHFSAKPKRNIPLKSFCLLRGNLPVCVAKAKVFGCSLFLWAKGCNLECRPERYWKAVLGYKVCSIQVLQGGPALSLLLRSLLETSQGGAI